MEITKEMLIAEFARQIDFANFMESNHTAPFRKEFLEFAIQYILNFEDENNRLRKSYRIAVQDNAETCQLLFKAEDEVKQIKTRTVMEMARRLNAEAITIQDHTGKLGSVVLVGTIDQIAQEMIGETK